MREVIKTGRTVEDATELALAELGVSAEEAGIEVLELPQRRLFKSIPAKVRAYVEDEEVPEAPAPKEEKPLPKAAPKAAESPDAPKAEAPAAAVRFNDNAAKVGVCPLLHIQAGRPHRCAVVLL